MSPLNLLHELEDEAPGRSQKWSLLEAWIRQSITCLEDCEGLTEGLSDGAPDALPMHKHANRIHGRIKTLLEGV